MKLKAFNLFNLKDLDQLVRFTTIMMNDVLRVVNGNLSFEDNFNSRFVDVSFTAANIEVYVPHTLGRIPTGYILTKTNAAASIYSGTSTFTESAIYLKSSAIAETKILIF